MPSFTDSAKRQWAIRIDVNAIRAVRQATKVDLYAALDDGFKGVAALLADPVMLCDVLWTLCKAQAEKMSPTVTDEQFGAALCGDAIVEAADALVGGLIDFFPQQKARENLAEAWAKSKRIGGMMLDAGGERLKQLDPEAEAARLISALSAPSGASPASSDSTPALSPSAN